MDKVNLSEKLAQFSEQRAPKNWRPRRSPRRQRTSKCEERGRHLGTSIGSTERSNYGSTRLGVVGPTRATRLAVRRLGRRPQQRRNSVRQFSRALSAEKGALGDERPRSLLRDR